MAPRKEMAIYRGPAVAIFAHANLCLRPLCRTVHAINPSHAAHPTDILETRVARKPGIFPREITSKSRRRVNKFIPRAKANIGGSYEYREIYRGLRPRLNSLERNESSALVISRRWFRAIDRPLSSCRKVFARDPPVAVN